MQKRSSQCDFTRSSSSLHVLLAPPPPWPASPGSRVVLVPLRQADRLPRGARAQGLHRTHVLDALDAGSASAAQGGAFWSGEAVRWGI